MAASPTDRTFKEFRSWMQAVKAGSKDALALGGEGAGESEFIIRLGDSRQAAQGVEKRALGVQTNTAGGYLVPQEMADVIETALSSYTELRTYGTVVRTPGGGRYQYPLCSDFANKASIVAENASLAQVDPGFSALSLGAFKYSSGIVTVPQEMLEDRPDLPAWLLNLLVTRISRRQADDFTTGTGSGQPLGFTLSAPVGKTAASSSAVTSDEVLALKYSVDAAYRANGRWMMSDATRLAVSQLKASTAGSYLFAPRIAPNWPDLIDGSEVIINNSMPSLASGQTPIAYGSFSSVIVRDVAEVRMKMLVERYADSGRVGFYCLLRSDGALADAGTHPVKLLRMA